MGAAVIDQWSGLDAEAERYLQEVKKTQQSLLQMQSEKRTALIAGQWGQVQTLEQTEMSCQQKLRGLMAQRSQLLEKFRKQAVPGKNLQEVCRHLGWQQDAERYALLLSVKADAEKIRQQGWSLWVMAQRASRFYQQVLEAIAQGGKQSPCYQESNEVNMSSGGSLLDASI